MKKFVVLFLVFVSAFALLSCSKQDSEAQLIIVGAKVIASPNATPIENASIVIRNGLISDILQANDKLPAAKRTIDASEHVVTAGFWNAHVHFTEPKWANAAQADANSLNRSLREMLTQYGFTSVVDTGSDPRNTKALRDRIESGELLGPHIQTTGSGFVAEGGSPAYLETKLPDLTSPTDAGTQISTAIAQGADAIKIFTGSFLSVGETAVMPTAIVKAVTEQAHSKGKLVISHPQSLEGVQNAVDGGVDVLAHTAPSAGPWSDELIAKMKENGIALMPTLKLWRYEFTRFNLPANLIDQLESVAISQVRTFRQAGGKVVFGTDVGYMTEYDPKDEYNLLAKANLSFSDILAALTTVPESKFGDLQSGGTVEVGKKADLVILANDPTVKIENLISVEYTIRSGKIIFEAKK